MRKLLIPLMKPEDSALWGLIAVIAAYAVAGAVLAWLRARAGAGAAADPADD